VAWGFLSGIGTGQWTVDSQRRLATKGVTATCAKCVKRQNNTATCQETLPAGAHPSRAQIKLV